MGIGDPVGWRVKWVASRRSAESRLNKPKPESKTFDAGQKGEAEEMNRGNRALGYVSCVVPLFLTPPSLDKKRSQQQQDFGLPPGGGKRLKD